jgi:hypothetical protein
MRHFPIHATIALISASSLLLLGGCSNPHEARATEAIAILGSIADELSLVTDAESAEAATPRLAELGDRWRDNDRKQSNLKPLTTREMAKLTNKYAAQFESAMKRYDSERNRVKQIDGGAEALRALGDLTGQPQYRSK